MTRNCILSPQQHWHVALSPRQRQHGPVAGTTRRRLWIFSEVSTCHTTSYINSIFCISSSVSKAIPVKAIPVSIVAVPGMAVHVATARATPVPLSLRMWFTRAVLRLRPQSPVRPSIPMLPRSRAPATASRAAPSLHPCLSAHIGVPAFLSEPV